MKAFLDNLATHIAGRAGLRYKNISGQKRQLWIGSATEGENCDNPYAVLIVTDGEIPIVPVARIDVTVHTWGTDQWAAMQLATLIRDALRDAQGRPLRMFQLPAYRLNGVQITGPSIVGFDEANQKHLVLLRFECRVVEGGGQ